MHSTCTPTPNAQHMHTLTLALTPTLTLALTLTRLLDEAGEVLVAAGGSEGAGHADEDRGAVTERLSQVEAQVWVRYG